MGLFNTQHHHHRHTTECVMPREVTINENRAPTDESVRLLNEMQQKAQENIVQTIKVEGNEVNGLIMLLRSGRTLLGYEYILKFTLNGHEQIIQGNLDHWDIDDVRMGLLEPRSDAERIYFEQHRQGLVQLLYDEFSKKLAELILSGAGEHIISEIRNGITK